MLELACAAVIAFALPLAFGWARGMRLELAAERERADYWAEMAERNALERADYERALGLPLWDPRELERDLWARAAQGDEIAYEVVAARALRELGAAEGEEPLLQSPRGSGQAN